MVHEGRNLQSFLLLWMHVCVVMCNVGITKLTQVVGSLVPWHLKVPTESVLDRFTEPL